jgi:uncharacterized protein (DUF608 family)
VAFPLGGIGTGNVSIGGSGELKGWEIFNRPGKTVQLPYTFFSIWCHQQGLRPIAKILESTAPPPYVGSQGYETLRAPGLPRMRAITLTGEYPLCRVDFVDNDIPVKVSLEAFNPFDPLNDQDSGLPVAVILFRVKNAGRRRARVTVCGSFCNPVGHDGKSNVGRKWTDFGGNLNDFVKEDDVAGIRMSSTKYKPGDPRFGTMAVATTWKRTTHLLRWQGEAWWDDIQSFWDDFADDGKFEDNQAPKPSPEGMTDICSLGLRVELRPGEEAKLPFFIAWHFPVRLNEWNRQPEFHLKPLRNYYAASFKDAWDVIKYVVRNYERLERRTRDFHNVLFGSTIPPEVIDAISSQISTMRTNTCLRLDNGDFFGFEGCGESQGCCPMNCTHVWNYAQAVAYLFPELERSMRKTDFLVNTEPDGKMAFRTNVPTTERIPWTFHAAADGQMGCIIRLFREWKLSGDVEFLRKTWPAAKRALEYAWRAGSWDPDRDGVMDGVQHNTYDVEFVGPNTLTGTLYLAALKAAAQMAKALGDDGSAEEYMRIFERGSKKYDELLWNGEYYVQKLEDKDNPKYQYGEGCLSDQLLGQWLATQLGLGYVLPKEKVRKALRSIFKYNWKKDLSDHQNVERVYALGSEPGLVVCTWPKGGRPKLPLPYCDEVWTGIEYQVASHMIYEGMIEEGLRVVAGARSRHDGEKRNPWNEFECGDHYVRPMSSYALLLAVSGFLYDAPSATVSLSPALNQANFRCFFSSGSAWGEIGQKLTGPRMRFHIDVKRGDMRIQTLRLKWPTSRSPRALTCSAALGRARANATVMTDTGNIEVRFPHGLVLSEGSILRITLRPVRFR